MNKNLFQPRPFFSLFLVAFSAILIVFISCGNSKPPEPYVAGKGGVQFFEGSFEQAKMEAAATGKPLFVMLHATWCPSCKKMRKTVLPEKTVGDFFNSGYINVMVDYDSKEGKAFRDMYSAPGTPTLYIMNADGKVIRQHSGFMSEEQLLGFAKQG